MKYLFALMALVAFGAVGDAQAPKTAAPAPPPQAPVTKVVYFDHNAVADAFAKGTGLVNAPERRLAML